MGINNVFMQLPADVRETIATQAGILLSDFDPGAQSYSASSVKANILMATTGGIQVTCQHTIMDWADDVDNAQAGAKELQEGGTWDCKLAGTALTIDEDMLVRYLGSADVDTSETAYMKITPRIEIQTTDFTELWYVVPYGDSGGFIAIQLSNAFSSGGFSFASEKNNKGKVTFEFTGYGTTEDASFVPMDFYIRESTTAATESVTPASGGNSGGGSTNESGTGSGN